VNQSTGAIEATGLFPNPSNILRPGQYGKVRVAVETLHGALLVPQRAFPSCRAAIKNPGERVIVDGVQKVGPGMHVKPKLAQTPRPGN
jgi:membrane fusion protein (multidrug efflux system)